MNNLLFRFDELHYGKYVSMYMKNTFFFEKHPPLGKQLIAGVAYLAGYNGNYTFQKIGSEYSDVRKFHIYNVFLIFKFFRMFQFFGYVLSLL